MKKILVTAIVLTGFIFSGAQAYPAQTPDLQALCNSPSLSKDDLEKSQEAQRNFRVKNANKGGSSIIDYPNPLTPDKP